MTRRTKRSRHTSAASVFSDRLICGDCGATFGSKVWHSTDAYRTVIWRCNGKYREKGNPCATPHIRDEEIKEAFKQAMEKMLEQKEEIFSVYECVIAELSRTDKQDREMGRIQDELETLYAKLDDMVRENAERALNQEEYTRRFNALSEKCEEKKNRYMALKDQLAEKKSRQRKLLAFLDQLREADRLTDFDEHVFAGVVEQIIVRGGKEKREKVLTFCFKDGTEIAVNV